jgi:hypothetical protein
MIYTIYSKSSGKVLRVLSGPPEFVRLNVADDEGVFEGEVPETHIVVGGLPVPRPDEDLLAERLESAALDLRQRRDALLYATDWTQVPDAPVDRAAWAAYRQALRDLPDNTVDPLNPVWPEPPQ